MAQKGSSGSKVPARNGGNRRDPSQKIGLGGVIPPNYPGYTKVDGKGDPSGSKVPAGNGGNRRDPAQKIGLGGVIPGGYDGYTKLK